MPQSGIDLRSSVNAISDVVNNRPKPLRRFDQIYMKAADMLLHVDHASRCLADRNVVFIGDGDAIGLCLVHLHQQQIVHSGPKRVHVLDFDERMVLSVQEFAKRSGLADRVTSELYNVADSLPEHLWGEFDAFHMNPPFGKSNGGRSIHAFLRRGFEATGAEAIGYVVLADDAAHGWTREILRSTQKIALDGGWMISELVPTFHGYHLDDAPDLTSCSLVLRRLTFEKQPYASAPLDSEMRKDFYGTNSSLTVRYVRDRTQGGQNPSQDYHCEEYV